MEHSSVKRICSLLLALVMLVGMIPLSALAEGLHVESLTHLKVYVNEPVAGREADFAPGVAALPTNAAQVNTEQTDNLNYHHGVGWYDHTAGRYLSEGESFVAGHSYTVYVAVCVKNYFYQLSSSVEATVNDKTATVTKGYSAKTVVKYAFGVCKNPPPDITEVAVGGNLRPVAGKTPVFTLAYDSECMEIDYAAGSAFINGVAWYNSNTYAILDESDTFQAGQTYTMLVQFKAKGNYRFATSNGTSTVKGTIEGVEAKNVSYQTAQDPDESRYLKLQVKFTCEASDTLGGGANVISLQIPYPVGGHKMSYEPVLNGENCEYSAVTGNGFYDGVKWINRSYDYTYNTNSVFSTGGVYSVIILVKAKSIMQDDTRLRYLLHKDGSVDPYILATVNGMPARVEPYGDQSPAQVVQVIFDFPACNSTTRTIDDIVFTDIRKPVIGNTADTQGTVEIGYKENILATKKTVDVQWVEIPTSGSGARVMTASDTFKEGYVYAWMTDLVGDALTEYAVEHNQYAGSLYARGTNEAVCMRNGKDLKVVATYPPLTASLDTVSRLDIIGAVAPTVGQRPYYDASLTEAGMPYAEIAGVMWLENGNVMGENTTFKKGNEYTAVYTVKATEPYMFAETEDMRASVNGNNKKYNGSGTTGMTVIVDDDGQAAEVAWSYGTLGTVAYTGVTDYVELGGLMRPAPGQTPDFNVDISSPYTQCGGVNWYELDDNGYIVAPLGYDDCFKSDTVYRAEVRVLPTAGRSINLDSRGAVLNDEFTQYYYLPGQAVIVYAEYDTAYCISELDVIDVRYPIGGKMPSTLPFPITGGKEEPEFMYMQMVSYDNGADVDWHYEVAGAGFSRLTGRFKSDRRHRAYVQVATTEDTWFATDKDGASVVEAYIDGVPVDFSYITDSYLDDGAVNALEMARTYDLAKNIDGVFVEGMCLTDGLYLDSTHWGIQTEDTVSKEAGYAYYKDGVLTLHNYKGTERGEYDAIASFQPLTVHIEGDNDLETNSIGISINKELTLTGDPDAELYLYGDQYGVFSNNKVTVENGYWTMVGGLYDGIWLGHDMTVNGGCLQCRGSTSGICGDDWPTVTVNGGILYAESTDDDAIAWCDVVTAEKAHIKVRHPQDESYELWDGTTTFDNYACVYIFIPEDEPDVLMGDLNDDGIVNIADATIVFRAANGRVNLTDKQKAVADVNGDGIVNIADATMLFRYANGRIASL